MAQGLGAGILWGAVAGTAVVVGLAQVAPVVTLPTGTVATEAASGTPVAVVPTAPVAEVAAPAATAPVTTPIAAEPPAPAPVLAEGTAASPTTDTPAAPTAPQPAPPPAPAPAPVAPGDTAPDVATETPPTPDAPDAVPVPSAPSGPSDAPPASSSQAAPAAPGSESAPAARDAAPSAPATTQDLAAPEPGDAARPPRPDVPLRATDQTASASPVVPAIPVEPRQDAPVAAVGTVPEQPPVNPSEVVAAPAVATEPRASGTQDAPVPVADPPVAITEVVPEVVPEAAPEAAPDATAAVTPDAAPAPSPPAAEVRVGRLPRIGDETAPDVATDITGDPASPPVAALPGMPGRQLPTQPTPAAPAPGPLVAEDLGALAAFAVPFENPDSRPVLSIVLLDTGADDRPAAETMANFPFPLTVALDPTDAQAADTMRAYRAGGIEIAAFVRFPDDATAQDVAVAWDVHQTTLAESVALVDASDGAIQSQREPMAQVVAELVRSGHGFVTMSQGFNAGQKLAEREGIPSALVFRALDPSDRGAMTRALDQGAFRAGQDGRAVLTAPLSAETLAVLAEWGLGTRQTVVSLAPLSATLD